MPPPASPAPQPKPCASSPVSEKTRIYSRPMAPLTAKDPIPTYTIDLDEAPHLRYAKVAHDFAERMQATQGLFDEILEVLIPVAFLRPVVKTAAKHFLRGVFDQEENEELRGIAKIAEVDLWLLVALNTVLDSLLGCTSGAVLVRAGTRRSQGGQDAMRLMHFRTLDWGMDALRELLVVLEFVDSRAENPTEVIVRSITYAGFVGTLTATKENLSISMNFRPNHTCSTLALRKHQLLVLLGRRRSIGSILRRTIFEKDPNQTDAMHTTEPASPSAAAQSPLRFRAKWLAATQAPPCYLILCDGNEAAVIEKDLRKGSIRASTEFIVQTNHDIHDVSTSDPGSAPEPHLVDKTPRPDAEVKPKTVLGDENWLEESTERMKCMERKWKRHLQKNKKSPNTSIRQDTLSKWIRAYPIMAEETHFGCILDSKTGEVLWIQRGDFEGKPEIADDAASPAS